MGSAIAACSFTLLLIYAVQVQETGTAGTIECAVKGLMQAHHAWRHEGLQCIEQTIRHAYCLHPQALDGVGPAMFNNNFKGLLFQHAKLQEQPRPNFPSKRRPQVGRCVSMQCWRHVMI